MGRERDSNSRQGTAGEGGPQGSFFEQPMRTPVAAPEPGQAADEVGLDAQRLELPDGRAGHGRPQLIEDVARGRSIAGTARPSTFPARAWVE